MRFCLKRLSAVLLAVAVTSIAAATSGIFVPPQAEGLDFGAISAPVFPTQVIVSLSSVMQGMRTYV